MPIRPETRALYGPDWPQRSRRLREEAGWRCQCRGECGADPHPPGPGRRCWALYRMPHPVTGSVVILTVAHRNHDPSDNRPENHVVMCQRCHLTYDREQHAQTRARNAAHTRPRLRDWDLSTVDRDTRRWVICGLSARREELGITIPEMERRVPGLRRSSYIRLEHQATNPRVSTLQKIGAALGLALWMAPADLPVPATSGWADTLERIGSDEMDRQALLLRLTICRTRQGVSQEALADRMGVTDSAVRYLESRPDNYLLSGAQRYARALGGRLAVGWHYGGGRLRAGRVTRHPHPSLRHM